jgi:hypothetical protein
VTRRRAMRGSSRVFALAVAAIIAAACEGGAGLFVTSGAADTANGAIVGNVTANGAGQGGIQLVAIGSQRDSTVTDGTGTYRFAAVPAGQYSVTIQVPIGLQLGAGQSGTQTVSVPAGGSATANFALQNATGTP